MYCLCCELERNYMRVMWPGKGDVVFLWGMIIATGLSLSDYILLWCSRKQWLIFLSNVHNLAFMPTKLYQIGTLTSQNLSSFLSKMSIYDLGLSWSKEYTRNILRNFSVKMEGVPVLSAFDTAQQLILEIYLIRRSCKPLGSRYA